MYRSRKLLLILDIRMGFSPMKGRAGSTDNFDGPISTVSGSPSKRLKVHEVLQDLKAGLRTKDFMAKYQISLQEFEEVLKNLIRKGLLSKDEFRAWKAHKPLAETTAKAHGAAPPSAGPLSPTGSQTISTFVINEPEKSNSWALQLFSTKRERMHGAQFKVVLHGKKYSFVVERLLYRGPVKLLDSRAPKAGSKEKREQAMDFIARHGWAAYLENRAYAANFDADGMRNTGRARLVLLHCRNETFVAALHTPDPAINLFVGSSLETIRERLSKSVDTSELNF